MKELIQVAVFERRVDAAAAMSNLRKAGFRHHQLGLAERRPDSDGGVVGDESTWAKGAARTGAISALVGAAIGLIGILGFPGFPVTVAMGALFGGIVGAILGAVAHMGVPEEEARRYGQDVAAGSTLLLVKAGARETEARAILAQNRPRQIRQDVIRAAA